MLQAVLTLAMTAVHNRPQDITLLSPFLCHGLACAAASIPCHNKDVFSTALSCADALVGERSFSAFFLVVTAMTCVGKQYSDIWRVAQTFPHCATVNELHPLRSTHDLHSWSSFTT